MKTIRTPAAAWEFIEQCATAWAGGNAQRGNLPITYPCAIAGSLSACVASVKLLLLSARTLLACNARSGFHLDSTPYKILSVAASMAKVLQLFVLPVSGSHRSAGRDQTFWSACSLLWLSLVGSGYLVGGLLRPSYQLVEDQ